MFRQNPIENLQFFFSRKDCEFFERKFKFIRRKQRFSFSFVIEFAVNTFYIFGHFRSFRTHPSARYCSTPLVPPSVNPRSHLAPCLAEITYSKGAHDARTIFVLTRYTHVIYRVFRIYLTIATNFFRKIIK